MNHPKPQRLQRSRKKGSKLTSPNGLPNVYVGRPGKWGSPFVAGESRSRTEAYMLFQDNAKMNSNAAKRLPYPTTEEIKRELSGKNLVCWCPLSCVCHADVLLKIANE